MPSTMMLISDLYKKLAQTNRKVYKISEIETLHVLCFLGVFFFFFRIALIIIVYLQVLLFEYEMLMYHQKYC